MNLSVIVWTIVAVAALGAFYGLGQYNGLIALRNHIAEAWSDIDTELKRRYDLIPNMVEIVQGYARHEREVLEMVVRTRADCMALHGAVGRQAVDEARLSSALGRLISVAESYPGLKADQAFLRLQDELVDTENRIQAARRFYNGNVRDYRNKAESFPGSLIAAAFGFGPAEYLEFDSSISRPQDIRLP